MLKFSIYIIGLSILIFSFSPKIIIDFKLKEIDEEISYPPNDVNRISWNDAVRKFEKKLIGPESFTHDPITGDIFTGTKDGLIWKINKDLTIAEPITRIGENHPECGSEHMEYFCGRVLGLKFLKPDKLIVADAYRGIIQIDFEKKSKEILVGADSNELTKSLKFFNSLDVSKNGTIYFTVTSLKWNLYNTIYSIFEGDNSGRVYSFNMFTHDLKIIASDLLFPNGLTLTQDENHLIVCELNKRRLLKIDLTKSSENIEILIDKLPGLPDNIKRDKSNGYYVAMIITDSISTLMFLHKHPWLVYSISWLIPKWMIMKCFIFDSRIYRISEQGKILSIIDGTHPGIGAITEAYYVNDKIIFGNLFHPYFEVLSLLV